MGDLAQDCGEAYFGDGVGNQSCPGAEDTRGQPLAWARGEAVARNDDDGSSGKVKAGQRT